MQTHWHIQLLGELQARHGDQVTTRFRTRKTGLLLAYLACHLHRAHRREALMEQLWPESDPGTARTQLRHQVYLLRRLLEPLGTPAGGALLADRTSLRLNSEVVTTDVSEFEAALAAAKQAGDNGERVARLTHAVELYRGELLPGYFEDWVQHERQWLAEQYFQALGELLAHLERASEFERALDYARRGVSADPLREEGHRDLIRLLAAVGQPSAALRQYQELERRLKEQLETTPEAATRALVREIERLAVLRQQPAVGSPQVIRSSGPPVISSTEGENRLVTLLFADMSRSLETTRDLHTEDAAALVNRLLQAMVDVVLKYEGRIDRFQGDGLLAVFGVPHAHEDDPERAIQAALAIRAAAQHLELAVSAGINTGEVYVGPVAAERHQELTVMGPVVGLAARLQEQAQPGQILMGEVTQHLARRAFRFTPLFLGIKGLTQPALVYRVEGALVRPQKARGIEGLRATLIGRDEELAKLQAALAAVMQGEGQVVTLVGEAGVGKSRLVSELKQGARSLPKCGQQSASDSGLPTALRQEPSPLWLEGRCLELNMTAGYSLFVDLFSAYFAWLPEESDEARGARLAACLEECVARQELSAERAEEIGPMLGHLLSVRFGSDWDQRLKNARPEQIRHQTFLAVRDFFIALARRQPVVLVLEDLHWADNLSLDLISLLLEALPLAPLLLLCVYRSEREHKCWHLATIAARKCPERATEIPLRELTRQQSRLLVESLLTIEDLPAAVKELILEKSRGNPFFVEEVVRALIASRMVFQEGDVWRAQEEIEMICVPESIQSVIASRVDRLRPELKQVLQRASVIGRLFRPRLLEQVWAGVPAFRGSGVQTGDYGGPGRRLGREADSGEGNSERSERRGAGLPEPLNAGTPERLSAILWELEEQELIYQERVVPEAEYSFKHVLTQESIYRSILQGHRAGLHQQVAEAMEALYQDGLLAHYEQLAYHYERSDVDEKALEYLLKAGEKARRTYLNDEAVDYFERALARSRAAAVKEQPNAQYEAVKGLGRALLAQGNLDEAAARLREAAALAEELDLPLLEQTRMYVWHFQARRLQGPDDSMRRFAERSLPRTRAAPHTLEAALLHYLLAIDRLVALKREEYVEHVLRCGSVLPRLPYSEELFLLYQRLAVTYSVELNEPGRALALLDRFLQQAAAHHDLRAVGGVHLVLGNIRIDTGRQREARADLVAAAEMFRRIGELPEQTHVLNLLGGIALTMGELDAAACSYEEEIEISRQLGSDARLAFSRLLRGIVRLSQGRWQEAQCDCNEAVRLFPEADLFAHPYAAACLGHLRRGLGQATEAAAVFYRALETGLSRGAADSHTPGQFTHALANLLAGWETAESNPDAFRAGCCRLRDLPRSRDLPLTCWYLEPAAPHRRGDPTWGESFTTIPGGLWEWTDPLQGGSLEVAAGLLIRAANGSDLWVLNRTAPRLLRPAVGDFAIETVVVPSLADRPSIGGLLLWKSAADYLRLDRGLRGEGEISFQGRVGGKDAVFGRGLLRGTRALLRLERRGARVSALCSVDGEHWLSAGSVEFPAADPVAVGTHAIGRIDRRCYPGAYPEGTAIRFEAFQTWA